MNRLTRAGPQVPAHSGTSQRPVNLGDSPSVKVVSLRCC